MLKVERPTVQQNLNFIAINIALEGGGEAQTLFHMGSLIIFVRDCLKFKKNCGGLYSVLLLSDILITFY